MAADSMSAIAIADWTMSTSWAMASQRNPPGPPALGAYPESR
jgi:hypothetical protein